MAPVFEISIRNISLIYLEWGNSAWLCILSMKFIIYLYSYDLVFPLRSPLQIKICGHFKRQEKSFLTILSFALINSKALVKCKVRQRISLFVLKIKQCMLNREHRQDTQESNVFSLHIHSELYRLFRDCGSVRIIGI